MICQGIRKIFPWSVDQRCYGRSTRHPMVGRASTLWSVDQATFEWNGPKTESSVNDFLHKRAKMCNSDFLDYKLKSQKFNYRFDSISWFYATLWYQKRRENRLLSWYMIIPCCSSGYGPVPCPRPLAYCPPGRCFSLSSNPRALPPVTHGSALQAPECIQVLIFTTDLTDETDSCLVAIK